MGLCSYLLLEPEGPRSERSLYQHAKHFKRRHAENRGRQSRGINHCFEPGVECRYSKSETRFNPCRYIGKPATRRFLKPLANWPKNKSETTSSGTIMPIFFTGLVKPEYARVCKDDEFKRK
jgi:hypothetical protein